MLATTRRECRLWAALALGSLLTVLVLGTLLATPQPVGAQDPAQAAGEEGQAPHQPPNLFIHIVNSVGWVFGPILLGVSIALVFLIVLLAMDLRMSVAIPPRFVEEFTDTVNKRRFKEAFELARDDSSFLARVLTTGMSRLQYGIEDAREAAANMVDTIRANKEQLISYLAVIGTLGPLFGLVGTVSGMIQAFRELSETSGGRQPEFGKLAAALSHALVVTLIGIGLSLPAIFFHTLFRNRLTGISMDTANIGDDLLTQMYHNSRRPAPPAAPAGSPLANAVPPAPTIAKMD